MHADTIAAFSGGSLPAAIGIVRVSGPLACAIGDAVFAPHANKPITKCENNKLYYGKLLNDDGKTLDFCLAALFRAPRSYTGEDMLELYCHGSRAVVEAALRRAYALGARPARAGEFTQRAFLAGKLDLARAEAVADLIDARSEREAVNAAMMLDGALSREITEMRDALTVMTAHFYAVCDYPDEEIDPFAYDEARASLRASSARLDALHDSFARGSVLREGVPVAVVGRPNAGKSSLFNALSGGEHAIVTDEAGTTRDVLERLVSLNDGLVRLLDTAGIREAESKAERIGVDRALNAAKTARAVICVFDASQPLTSDDRRAIAESEGTLRCAVLNKSDLPVRVMADELDNFDAVFALSALTGEGIAPLATWLAALVPDDDDMLVTSPRQAALLRAAADDLRAAAQSAEQGMTADAFLADVERAARTLGEITGDTASPDIAAAIFSRFCVGK